MEDAIQQRIAQFHSFLSRGLMSMKKYTVCYLPLWTLVPPSISSFFEILNHRPEGPIDWSKVSLRIRHTLPRPARKDVTLNTNVLQPCIFNAKVSHPFDDLTLTVCPSERSKCEVSHRGSRVDLLYRGKVCDTDLTYGFQCISMS